MSYHFSPAFRVGDTIHVSGIIGTGVDGRVPAEPADEFAAVFTQMQTTLEAAGASLADVVELTSFHVDLTQIGPFMKAKNVAIGEAEVRDQITRLHGVAHHEIAPKR